MGKGEEQTDCGTHVEEHAIGALLGQGHAHEHQGDGA
jgi:hypothetical protein